VTQSPHRVFLPAVEAPRPVGALLAFAAGVVDACTFFALFGLFVAQVTGSFVLAGAQIVSADAVNLIRTLAIPVFFLAGFATVFLIAAAGQSSKALTWALAVELALVAGFALAGLIGAPFSHPNAPLALAASLLGVCAMGVQSALVRVLMKGLPSTNVMTTNTTMAAVEIAQWVLATRRVAKLPYDVEAAEDLRIARTRFAVLWPVLAGFLAGTAVGSLAFQLIGFWAPLMSVAALAGLMVWAARFAPPG